jgi:uncharacterized protein YodC (DUF2158 family)
MTKEHFSNGDRVQVRQDIPDKPIMIISGIEREEPSPTGNSRGNLIGVKAFWFDSSKGYQEKVFNTKDLVAYDDSFI